MAVGFGAEEGGMVGRDENAVVAVSLQRGVERGDDFGVDLFQGFDLWRRPGLRARLRRWLRRGRR